MKPLAIDLYCGLGGWTEGLLAAGWDVIGFDIERHEYGEHRYPAQLVLQDVRTLNGAQFRNADLIVASPPCQEYSYMAMPWTRAKKIAEEYRAGIRDVRKLTELFDACFRIQREACEAAGRHIPLIVENVRGAIPWVRRSRWNYGSFHLWGDVPALMPMTKAWCFDADDRESYEARSLAHRKQPGIRDGEAHTRHLTNPHEHTKNSGGSWFNVAHNTTSGKGMNAREQAIKGFRHFFHDCEFAQYGSKSSARKAASAMIAKIPFALAYHIGRTYLPKEKAA